ARRAAANLPDCRDQPLGEHRLALTLAGHEPRIVTVTVQPDATTDLGELSLTPMPGVIEIPAAPDLRYELRLHPYGPPLSEGAAPATLSALAPGDYTLTFHRTGWRSRTEPIRVVPGGTLRPVPEFPTGRVTIHSEPAGALVLHQGVTLGRTPLDLDERDPVAISLRLVLPGHDDAIIGGLIEAGGTLALHARLDSSDRVVAASELGTPPRVISQTAPELTEQIRRAGGSALLSFVVDKDGVPTNLRVQQTDNNAFSRLCLSAVASWRFSPGLTRAGQPVNVRVQVPLQVSAR
ncbi:MAG: TonB family protein, partial [Burkholderiales bacterium]|nr:TonB family protein [Opitutaceae bacterium]